MVSLAAVADWLKTRTTEPCFKEYLATGLTRLCSISSVPGRDLRNTMAAERRCFDTISELITNVDPERRLARYPILHDIRHHPEYTKPHYSDEEEVYLDRSNLVLLWPQSKNSTTGKGIAINAHVDTVAPFFPVSRQGDVVFGRGACDDKSGCMVMVGAIRLLKEIQDKFKVPPGDHLVFMFVIDEEIGGNGSLSLALDDDLKKWYDVVVVLECCEQQVYSSNRGAVWYKVEIPPALTPEPIILAFDIVRELENEGAEIRSESSHPLFSQSMVQTSHGILGRYGEYPSRVCGYLELELHADAPYARIRQYIEEGISVYTQKYGDQTAVIGRETGMPALARHYSLEERDHKILLRIWSTSGHMAASSGSDNAITKASYITRCILDNGLDLRLSFPGDAVPTSLVLEGGQGFIPTHSLRQVTQRLRDAVQRACKTHASRYSIDNVAPQVSFEKLHNDAFEGRPDSPALQILVECAERMGMCIRRPAGGWAASCDARLFARLNPGMEVITTGPGKLEYAHSDREQIDITELARSCAVLTLFLLARACPDSLTVYKGET